MSGNMQPWPMSQQNQRPPANSYGYNWNRATSPMQMSGPQPMPNYPAQYPYYDPNQSLMQQQQNQYYPPQEPVQQPMTQQQPQQSVSSVLNGRMVDDINRVTAIEVPMDGTRTFFPLEDESMVYMKYWDSQGKLRDVKYVRAIDPNEVAATQPVPHFSEEDFSEYFKPINDRLTTIEQILIAATQPPVNNASQNKRGNPNSKKEES